MQLKILGQTVVDANYSYTADGIGDDVAVMAKLLNPSLMIENGKTTFSMVKKDRKSENRAEQALAEVQYRLHPELRRNQPPEEQAIVLALMGHLESMRSALVIA